jgi:hypothetical protein
VIAHPDVKIVTELVGETAVARSGAPEVLFQALYSILPYRDMTCDSNSGPVIILFRSPSVDRKRGQKDRKRRIRNLVLSILLMHEFLKASVNYMDTSGEM